MVATKEANANRISRLESLPVTGQFKRLFITSGFGWALDAMDIGLVSFIVAALATQWHLDAQAKSWVLSAGFAGMGLGAVFGGALADRFGRRRIFTFTMVLYGVATGFSAIVGELFPLIILRIIAGIGLGAELPVASTLVSEFAPRRIRGRVIVWLEAFWAVGSILAAVIGTYVISKSQDGWRWGFLLGAIPAVYALLVRFNTPESVRFLESRGRFAEAERVVERFEKQALATAKSPVASESTADTTSPETISSAGNNSKQSIWSAQFRRRTLGLWIIWFMLNFAYYGAFAWIPSLLMEMGFSLVKSFEFTLLITLAQLPGYAVSAWLIEKLGRRYTLLVFLLGSAVGAAFFGLARDPSSIVCAGMLLSFFNLGAWGALYALSPEMYPTAIRGRGTGAAAGFGRIASIVTPLLVPVFMHIGGTLFTFAVFAVAMFIASASGFVLPETRGKNID